MLEWPYLVATPCVTKVGSGIPGDQISSAVRLTQVVDDLLNQKTLSRYPFIPSPPDPDAQLI